MDIVARLGVSMLDGDGLIRAREVDEDVGQSKRSSTAEDNRLDRVVDRDVVDDGRHLGGREAGSRVGVG